MLEIKWDVVPKIKNSTEQDVAHHNFLIQTRTSTKELIGIHESLMNIATLDKDGFKTLLVKDEKNNILFQFLNFEGDLLFLKGNEYKNNLRENYSLMSIIDTEFKVDWLNGSHFLDQFEEEIYSEKWQQFRLHGLMCREKLYPCLITSKVDEGKYVIKIECVVNTEPLKLRFDSPYMLMWKDYIDYAYSSDAKKYSGYIFKKFDDRIYVILSGNVILEPKPTCKLRMGDGSIDNILIDSMETKKYNDKFKYTLSLNESDCQTVCKTIVASKFIVNRSCIRITTEFEIPVSSSGPGYYTSTVLEIMQNALKAYLPQK